MEISLEKLSSPESIDFIHLQVPIATSPTPSWMRALTQLGFQVKDISSEQEFESALATVTRPQIIFSDMDCALDFWKKHTNSLLGDLVRKRDIWVIEVGEDSSSDEVPELLTSTPTMTIPLKAKGGLDHGLSIVISANAHRHYQNSLEVYKKNLQELKNLTSGGAFPVDIAHDIANMNTIVIGSFVQIEKIIQKSATEQTIVKKILMNCKRGTRCVERINEITIHYHNKSLSSNKAKSVGPRPQLCNLKDIVLEAADYVSVKAQKQMTSIRVHVGGKIMIRISQIAFLQCLVSLLTNTLQAVQSKEESWLSITTRIEGSTLYLQMTNSGQRVDLEGKEQNALSLEHVLPFVKKTLKEFNVNIDYLENTEHTTLELQFPAGTFEVNKS